MQALVARIKREQGSLNILVNDVWGADFLAEWNVPVRWPLYLVLIAIAAAAVPAVRTYYRERT